MTYANEWDPYAAQWLARVLPGTAVDTRSIKDVMPADVAPWTRAHFFAGIGGWELALRWAGWPEDRPVWTGSCPCQPFSVAGKGKGKDDDRHLWPEMLRLITECRPPTIFGEQVASSAGRLWLAGVRVDLEALGYAVGAADLCAAGVGAPHIRQRLYWVAHAVPAGWAARRPRAGDGSASGGGGNGGVAHAGRQRVQRSGSGAPGGAPEGVQGTDGERKRIWPDVGAGGAIVVDGLADAQYHGQLAGAFPGGAGEGANKGRLFQSQRRGGGLADMHQPGLAGRGGDASGRGSDERPAWARCWDDAIAINCTDGKTRRIGSGVQPLAHGISSRVGRLRAYGNAIVPALAAEFIAAFMDAEAA